VPTPQPAEPKALEKAASVATRAVTAASSAKSPAKGPAEECQTVAKSPEKSAEAGGAGEVVLRSREETIDWERRCEQRQKQIDMGKSTEGYALYKATAPGPRDPGTPRADTKLDRKEFNFQLKVWRTFLHKFDP